jgi:hypothetical protein
MTETLSIIAAIIYFGINIFYAGMYYEDEGFSFKTKREKVILVIVIVFIMLLFLPLSVILFLVDFLKKISIKLELMFWWSFLFTKKFSSMTLEERQELEKYRKNPTSWRNRYRNWCIDVCLKRKSNQKNFKNDLH